MEQAGLSAARDRLARRRFDAVAGRNTAVRVVQIWPALASGVVGPGAGSVQKRRKNAGIFTLEGADIGIVARPVPRSNIRNETVFADDLGRAPDNTFQLRYNMVDLTVPVVFELLRLQPRRGTHLLTALRTSNHFSSISCQRLDIVCQREIAAFTVDYSISYAGIDIGQLDHRPANAGLVICSVPKSPQPCSPRASLKP